MSRWKRGLYNTHDLYRLVTTRTSRAFHSTRHNSSRLVHIQRLYWRARLWKISPVSLWDARLVTSRECIRQAVRVVTSRYKSWVLDILDEKGDQHGWPFKHNFDRTMNSISGRTEVVCTLWYNGVATSSSPIHSHSLSQNNSCPCFPESRGSFVTFPVPVFL